MMLSRLRARRDRLSRPGAGGISSQAGVLLALTDKPDDPEVILTQRAQHLSSHSGEVSFPGGKWEAADASLEITALRETEEEIGISRDLVEVLGAMPTRKSRWGIAVTPYVGIVPADPVMTPNPGELDSIFRVPLSYFLESDQRARTDMFGRQDRSYWAPAYVYEGYEIWGLTAGFIVEFLNHIYDAGIGVESAAPVRRWG
mgnify:CR=1 FL=1